MKPIMRGSREKTGAIPPRPRKSHVAIGVLGNTGTDPSREAIASQRRSIPPSVKQVALQSLNYTQKGSYS